jgi:hypothetical protein
MKARWFLAWLLGVSFALPGLAGEKVTLYLFNSRTCVNCLREEEFLAGLRKRIPELEVRSFEVQFDPANAKLLVQVAEAFGVEARGVPVTFIGPFAPIMGYESDETTGRLIEERVRGVWPAAARMSGRWSGAAPCRRASRDAWPCASRTG